MSYKIKLKFVSKNNEPVPNIYYEASSNSRNIFSKGYSQKNGESRIFDATGAITNIKVPKHPKDKIQLLSLQPIINNKLSRDKINEIYIKVPVNIVSVLLEKNKDGTYERNLKTLSTHTIQSGESLDSIAKKYNLDVDDLAEKNKISNKNKIQKGQVLKIKNVKSSPVKAIDPKIVYPTIIFHLVQKGDSLSSIANKYKVSVESLKSINSLNENKVYLNQKLYIKESGPSLDKKRQQAGFLILISILDASKRKRSPISTVTGKGTKQFYISISGQLAAGLGVGGSIQVGVATDKRGQVGIFVTVNGQAVAAGSSGFAVDGGVNITKAQSIKELAGLGYSTGASLHLLGGGSVAVGDDGGVDISAGFGIGANSNAGAGYTYIIPIN